LGLAALCGFVAGILVAWLLLSRYQVVIPLAGNQKPGTGRSPLVVRQSLDDSGPGIIQGTPARPASPPPGSRTTRETSSASVTPAPLEAPKLEADPIGELRSKKLILPIQGAKVEPLKGMFQEMRGSHMHQAVDILAPRNTPVLAVEEGKIARLFYSQAGGITIYQFDPEEKYVYYYAHLERYADTLHESDRVSQGQLIGYVGTSGNAPPGTPHLHFAIFKLTEKKHWWEGTPVDPYEVFR
jgi:murein DD-endopeptidase MepM/ murein hydrolase activator NlpD